MDKLWSPEAGRVEKTLKEFGYALKSDFVLPGAIIYDDSYDDYYEHPESRTTVRVSDHSPIFVASQKSNILVHPGSFDTFDQVERLIEVGSKKKLDSTYGRSENFNNLQNKALLEM